MISIPRRTFIKSAAAAAIAPSLAPALLTRRPSANESIRVAMAGLNGRGQGVMNGFHRLKDVKVVALCDPDTAVLDRVKAKFSERGEDVDVETDIRRLLDRDDIDAVGIATPNHWHALMTIWACQAGKDVYVEKPVSHNVFEGRQMVTAARMHNRIVQTGTQTRSSHAVSDAINWVRAGNLGKITLAQGLCYKPRKPIGKVDGPQPVPATVDYDLWTGPARKVDLRRKRLHYDWHWDKATGNGDLGNQGVHQMDMCRWAIGADELPPRVVSVGGRLGYDDDGNTPNTQLVYLEYEPAPVLFEVRGLPQSKEQQATSWAMNKVRGMSVGVVIHCENGWLKIPNYTEAHAFGIDGEKIRSWKGAKDHVANFVDVMRSRTLSDLNADIAEGHLSAAMCHVGNASLEVGRTAARETIETLMASAGPAADAFTRMRTHLDANEVDLDRDRLTVGAWLRIDRQRERFIDHEAANTHLSREYRAPFVVPDLS